MSPGDTLYFAVSPQGELATTPEGLVYGETLDEARDNAQSWMLADHLIVAGRIVLND